MVEPSVEGLWRDNHIMLFLHPLRYFHVMLLWHLLMASHIISSDGGGFALFLVGFLVMVLRLVLMGWVLRGWRWVEFLAAHMMTVRILVSEERVAKVALWLFEL